MGFGYLVFPAVVGFLFLAVSRGTRFGLMRLSGYQVVFISALVGTFFLILARILVLVLHDWCLALQWVWQVFAPFEYSGTIGLSAAAALTAALLWNGVTDKHISARRAARRGGNQILWLLRDSLAKNRMVEITLRSKKSYVGYTQDTGITTHRADPDITLIPMASGYRHHETRELVLTTSYGPKIAGFLASQPNESAWSYKNFQVAFPFSEIVSARFFDPTVFALFQSVPDDSNDESSPNEEEDGD